MRVPWLTTPRCGGCQADERATLHKVLRERIRGYKQKHGIDLHTPSIAQMLSNTLYQKRFFPYYTFNICAGLDKDGKGCVYGYDAVGSFEYHSPTGLGPLPSLRSILETLPFVTWKLTPDHTIAVVVSVAHAAAGISGA